MLAPSAAQRVTPVMQHIGSLSAEYDVPIHTHLLETRTQAVTGLKFYGESVTQSAARYGILTHRTTIAQFPRVVWNPMREIRSAIFVK